jgi:signal peptidase I
MLNQPGQAMPDDNNSPELPGSVTRAAGWLRDLVETLVPAVVIAILINLFLAQATRVYGQSMEPNLHTNQRLVIEKVSYRFHGPRRGDIVVLKLPDQSDELLIKRVIGLPGERVEIRDGHVYVDGALLDEPYLDQRTPGNMASRIIPPLHVFVLGDNRMASNDSRAFGPVSLDNLLGKAWASYWPLAEMGIVD